MKLTMELTNLDIKNIIAKYLLDNGYKLDSNLTFFSDDKSYYISHIKFDVISNHENISKNSIAINEMEENN